MSLRSRFLACAGVAVGFCLYLAGLTRLPIQRGNEPMYAAPPIWMIESGDYLVPHYEGGPFLQKPPLTWWILAGSYKLLGVSVFAARLPSALAALATILLVGLWVRRRSGERAGWLASLVLMFSFSFLQLAVTFAADTFLTFAITLAVIAVDGAARNEDGSDARWGLAAGAALALAFWFKGLVGVVLPAGAVVAGLLLDRRLPVRPVRRAAIAAGAVLLLLAPWHWKMHERLGGRFWRTFYWENQFLRGASTLYMGERGPFYYLGFLAWGLFPWSMFLPGSLRRAKASSAPLGWFLFALVFWTIVVQKREVYLLTLFPAVAVLVAESLARESESPSRWRGVPWWIAALLSAAACAVWFHAFPAPVALAGPGRAIAVGFGFALLAAALAAGAFRRSESSPFVAALACGLLLGTLQLFEARLAPYDPAPRWGASIRSQCGASGCDTYMYGIHAYNLDFYSGHDWVIVPDLSAGFLPRLTHERGFLVLPTEKEGALASLPFPWKVVDRAQILDKTWLAAALGDPKEPGFRSLTLVEFERTGG